MFTSFYSKLVRLEAYTYRDTKRGSPWFLFQTGSIRRRIEPIWNMNLMTMFLFQTGSIRSLSNRMQM